MTAEPTLFDAPPPPAPAVSPVDLAVDAITRVRESYAKDARAVSSLNMPDAAALYWQIVRELDRAAVIVRTGEDPGDGFPRDTTSKEQ